jgi:phthalate 4,5-dioxygenase oxygenase subunit
MKPETQELLVRTGPGTPCGNMLRAYWQPVALATDLGDGTAPIPVTVMSEELVLYRDAGGKLGLLGRRCPHRGVDLAYARIESEGLRCIYHGWLLDGGGRCLDQPGVPKETSSRPEIRRHTAYPCHEAGGVIFAYLGGGEPPVFPNYEFLDTTEDERYVAKVWHNCNYLQAVEGNLDQVHLSYLHRLSLQAAYGTELAETAPGSKHSPTALLTQDSAPEIIAQPTEFGMREVVTRQAPEGIYVKVENFVMPGFAAVPGPVHAQGGYLVNWHVPVDDVTHMKYMVVFKRGGIDKAATHRTLFSTTPFSEDRFTKAGELYPQDRRAMAAGDSFAGLGRGFAFHDLVICEAQGPISDRTNEYLGGEDKSVVLLRRVMLDAIDAVRDGRDPPHVIRDAARRAFPEIVVIAEVIPESKDPEAHVDERIAARAVPSRHPSDIHEKETAR